MSNQTERRIFPTRISLRSVAGQQQVSGRAAAFGVLSQDLGGFFETISPTAFARALREKQDTILSINHDANLVLGRTKSGTLALSQDKFGLNFRCTLGGQQYARDLGETMSRGDVDQCSFQFRCPPGGDSWDEGTDEDGMRFVRRTLLDVDLLDVSVVTFPAYNVGTYSGVDDIQLPGDVSALTHPSNASFNSIPQSVLIEARARASRAGIRTVRRPAPRTYTPYVPMTEAELKTAAAEVRYEKWLEKFLFHF